MKLTIIIFTTFLCNSLTAQQRLDTIYVNEQKNVALFFPKPIRQGITGASHFVFTYNRESEQYFGLLQAKPGAESNLLTITNDGQLYSYILKYSEKLTKLNYFVKQTESIGNEKPKMTLEKPYTRPKENYVNRVTFFEKFSNYILKLKFESLATKRKKGLKLQLHKMVYHGSEVYLAMELINNSGIDFEIDYLNIYIVNGNKKRKASYQKLQQEVIYKYKFPEIVKNKDTKQFVLALPKFVLATNEKLLVELKEAKGSRKVILKYR